LWTELFYVPTYANDASLTAGDVAPAKDPEFGGLGGTIMNRSSGPFQNDDDMHGDDSFKGRAQSSICTVI